MDEQHSRLSRTSKTIEDQRRNDLLKAHTFTVDIYKTSSDFLNKRKIWINQPDL